MEENDPTTSKDANTTPSDLAYGSVSDKSETLERAESSTSKADIPPDGGYGWVCVGCNFFINAHTWGLNSSYGIFLSYYLSHDYFPSTSPLAYAFIGGLSISQAMLIAPLATHIIHRYGTKVCLYLGVFFETLSLIGSSFAKQKWQLILSQGICFGWGMGLLFVGTVGIIPQWFVKKRSVANAIAAAGSGLGGMMYSLAAQRMIDTLGLPWAFRILGICTFVVNLTGANLLRDRNKQVGSRHKAFDITILKRIEFILLQGWSYFSMLGYTILIFSLPAYAKSVGLSAHQGSIISALFNLGQMLGRPFIGLASDRWGRLNVATLCTLLCGIFCFLFWIPSEIAPSKMGLVTFFAIIGGTVAGTFWASIAPVCAEIVGLKDLPSGLSLTWVLMTFPTTCAEPIALELRRSNAHHWIFLPPQIFTACMYFGGAACLWLVRVWKVGQLEEASRLLQIQGARQESVIEVERDIIAGGEHLEKIRSHSSVKQQWNGKGFMRRLVLRKIV